MPILMFDQNLDYVVLRLEDVSSHDDGSCSRVHLLTLRSFYLFLSDRNTSRSSGEARWDRWLHHCSCEEPGID